MGFLKLQLPEERPSWSFQDKGSQAGDLVVIHKSRQTENAVIPAGMQESSAMDGDMSVA